MNLPWENFVIFVPMDTSNTIRFATSMNVIYSVQYVQVTESVNLTVVASFAHVIQALQENIVIGALTEPLM